VVQFGVEDVIPLHVADVTLPEWHTLRGHSSTSDGDRSFDKYALVTVVLRK
jgi:hypothetical protein